MAILVPHLWGFDQFSPLSFIVTILFYYLYPKKKKKQFRTSYGNLKSSNEISHVCSVGSIKHDCFGTLSLRLCPILPFEKCKPSFSQNKVIIGLLMKNYKTFVQFEF